jgi:hypothetical protein
LIREHGVELGRRDVEAVFELGLAVQGAMVLRICRAALPKGFARLISVGGEPLEGLLAINLRVLCRVGGSAATKVRHVACVAPTGAPVFRALVAVELVERL